jgi:DNA-binding response OmpR family regulator
MKILIADDQLYNRDILRFILEDKGYDCVLAADGREAVAAFGADSDIGVVLMDVNMPVLDGIAATRQICQMKAARYVTIMFVTAFDDPEVLVQCLDAGGDDFIPKPINNPVLLSKINAHIRNQETYNKLKQAHETLRFHQHLMEREHQIVERVFANGRERVTTECDNLMTYTSPLSLFNGDLVLSAPSPSGGLYVLLGDFTGHGLAAAIGSLPVTGIFYDFAARQASVAEMVTQINRELNKLLPVGMYLCAAVMHLQRNGRGLSLWQGGINDSLVFQDEQLSMLISSDHVPLGIIAPADFDSRTQQLEFAQGSRLYFYTDGVSDAKNNSGDVFGTERIEQSLGARHSGRVMHLVDEVKRFQADLATDDMSLIELVCQPCVHRRKLTGELLDVSTDLRQVESFPWHYRLCLVGDQLRRNDVVTHLLAVLASVPGMTFHLESLYTIISELFSNALEHGVLNLDSCIKDTPGGLADYYRQREQSLAQLGDHSIEIQLAFLPGQPSRLRVTIADSGRGFDADALWSDIKSNDRMHGRGLHLVKSLCSELHYSEYGSTATAIYSFA